MAARWWASSAKAEKQLGYRYRPLDETLQSTIDWYAELRRAGAFDGDGLSRFGLLSAGMRLGERVGVVGLMRAAERRLGRRLVAGV